MEEGQPSGVEGRSMCMSKSCAENRSWEEEVGGAGVADRRLALGVA